MLEVRSLAEVPELAVAHGVDVVLLDVGGVLADDVWERMLLDPDQGLAVRWDMDPGRVRDAGAALWGRFSRGAAHEDAWWAALEEQLAAPIALPLRDELRAMVRGNDDARPVLTALRERSLPYVLVSNNTTFWWPRQLQAAGITDLLPATPRFLSCTAGVTKDDRPGLLEHAVAAVAAPALLVDDRVVNLERGAELGLVPVWARFGTGRQEAA